MLSFFRCRYIRIYTHWKEITLTSAISYKNHIQFNLILSSGFNVHTYSCEESESFLHKISNRQMPATQNILFPLHSSVTGHDFPIEIIMWQGNPSQNYIFDSECLCLIRYTDHRTCESGDTALSLHTVQEQNAQPDPGGPIQKLYIDWTTFANKISPDTNVFYQ